MHPGRLFRTRRLQLQPLSTCGGIACIPSGCMDPVACNYNPLAECEGEACDAPAAPDRAAVATAPVGT